MKKILSIIFTVLMTSLCVNAQVMKIYKGNTLIDSYTKDQATNVVFKEVVSTNNGHEYVDLGLPSGLRWATCNIGADKPEEFGLYFAWGETIGYSQDINDGHKFDWANYKWCNGSSTTMTKYCDSSSYGKVDNKTSLEPADDAAHVNWGGAWRMPTKAELEELRTNCTWMWTTQNRVYGCKFVGPNGNSIFLPAAGCRRDSDLRDVNSYGNYWSSSLGGPYSYNAYHFLFNSSNVSTPNSNRLSGQSIRAVCPSEDSSNNISVTSITVTSSKKEINVDESLQLSATVSPSNATNKSVTWSSSNASVATVSSSGLLKAVKAGSVIITATAQDGSGVKGTCSITVLASSIHNGHEYVDLGLPSGLKWATCNVGASKPEDYGDYFAWGETTTKTSYTMNPYKWFQWNPFYSITKYCTDSSDGKVDNKTTLELSDDAAHANWGGSWRMPTMTEFSELCKKCKWEWKELNGKKGYKVTGPNGNYIFLPAAGSRNSTVLNSAGTFGVYWSSTLYKSSFNAYRLFFDSSYNDGWDDFDGRHYGQSVRAVYH